MTFPENPASGGAERRAESSPEQVRQSWAERRREKIVEEIARNRRGEYTVPTWVLALALALIVGGWLALVVLS